MTDLSERVQSLATNGKPLLNPLLGVGLADPVLDVFTDWTDRYKMQENIDPAIADYEMPPDDYEGDVFLPLLYSRHWHGNIPYLVLAHVFRIRGYRPIVPLCHDMLPMCLRKSYWADDAATCAVCRHETTSWFDAFGLEPRVMDDILPDGYEVPASFEDLSSVTHRGVDVSRHARATVRKFLRKHRLNEENDETRELLRRFTLAGIKLVDLTNAVIDQYDIRATVAHHSHYNTGGVLLDASATRDIPSISVGPFINHREGVLAFGNAQNHNSRPPYSNISDVCRRLQRPLTDEQSDRIDAYMKGRRDGEAIPDHKHFAQGSHESVSFPDDVTVLGLFSNIVWDASQQGSHVVFNNPFSWILSTIETVSEQDDIHLVIKPHPAEAIRPTNDKVGEWVEAKVTPIPNNVTLLEADTDVSPYELMAELDVGLVYNSTLGLEMAYEGLPVVLAGDAHYRRYGLAFEPETTSEYLSLLENPDDIEVSDEMQRLARRYAYFFFFEKMIEVPVFRRAGGRELDDFTHEELRDSPAFDFIVKQILADRRTIAADPDTLESVVPETDPEGDSAGVKATASRESSR
jgi:hypothetical protein